MRTWLFVPGHDKRKLVKALASDAEAVIIDWEDAVPQQNKEAARTCTRNILTRNPSSQYLTVRINSAQTDAFSEDLSALAGLPISAVMLPKVEKPTEVEKLAGTGLQLIPLIESALGIEQALEIARAHRAVKQLAFGTLDFLADIGGVWTPDGMALHYARSRLVISGRIAKLERPLDGVFPHLNDLEGLRQEAVIAKTLGFGGKLLIHPNQISTARAVFTPTEEEVQQAQRIVDAAQNAANLGQAALRVDGIFVDPPVVRWALRILQERESQVQGEPDRPKAPTEYSQTKTANSRARDTFRSDEK